METKKINYAKEKQYGYTRHIEQVVNHNAEVLENALNRIEKLEKTKLSALLPVAPTQRWIPVSERLPEPNRAVLTYVNTGKSETFCLANWNDACGDWEEWIGTRMLESEMEYKVLAWMPLPQPYKGESENKECWGCHYNDGEPHAECVVCDKAAGTKEKVIAEIDKQGEWLAEAGYNAYNVDIAFGSIIRALRKWLR